MSIGIRSEPEPISDSSGDPLLGALDLGKGLQTAVAGSHKKMKMLNCPALTAHELVAIKTTEMRPITFLWYLFLFAICKTINKAIQAWQELIN